MTEPNYDASSILSFSDKNTDKSIKGEGYRRVVEELEGQGVEPLVTRGQLEQHDIESGLVQPGVLRVVEMDGERRLTTEPLSVDRELGATSVRAYYSKLAEGVELTGAHVINTVRVRELDKKTEAYRLIHQYQPGTQLVQPNAFGEQVATMRTDRVVLKPVKSADSRGLVILTKDDLYDPTKFALSHDEDGGLSLIGLDGSLTIDLTAGEGYLLQEMIDTTKPYPSGIKIISACQQEYEAKKQYPKEVRLMVYWDKTRADKQLIIPYGRIFTPLTGESVRTKANHDDDWLLLDIQNGLPHDLDGLAADVVARILDYGHVDYLHGAIDVAWDGNRWYVMELNMWFPAPPSYKLAESHGVVELADIHRREMASLLANSAKDAKAKHGQMPQYPDLNVEH